MSNPNSRATRLRISCDIKYPHLINHISSCIRTLLPNNKVSHIKRKGNCIDISCYSNKWESWLCWKARGGSKFVQEVKVPNWIKSRDIFIKKCLKGLIETDGSIYKDRKYIMVNFVSIIPNLTSDVIDMIKYLGFEPNVQICIENKINKYTIRVSKNSEKFIRTLGIDKS